MMDAFLYNIPTKVYFGKNQLGHLGEELSRFGKKVLLVYGGGSIKRTGLYDRLIEEMANAGLSVVELPGVEPNPRIGTVRKGVEICKAEGVDVVLAVGGGSTIDCAKFVAAGAKVDFDPWKFLTYEKRATECLPIVTVLTLAATGSEMDAGGVITNPETNDKIGGGAACMRPSVSFLDPTLTYSVSRFQTASGSADIMSHILEVYFCMDRDLDMLEGFMESMLRAVIRNAPIALAEPDNYEARANLMWTASWAINGFIEHQKPQAWTCHPMEHELSAFYDITHGLGLAILTPRWMEYCLSEKTVSRYVSYGVNVWGIDKNLPEMEIAKKSIELTADFLFNTLGLQKTLTEIGIGTENFDIMSYKAARKGTVLPAFIPLTKEDIRKIFEMCL